MGVAVVIPARFASTRFPGKPLALVAGVPMLARVWAIAKAAAGVDRVVVATDDARIAHAVAAFGGEAVMTPESCRNGTERTKAAVDALNLR
ncbi:MAG: cytidylyltransferase domain-containing protein, partial [Rhodospirillales bacterium]